MAKDTKQRMVETAAGLLQAGGQSAAAFTEVLAASGAARGAIYHHFPGGKTELARDAVEWTGRRVRAELAAIEASDPDAVVAGFLICVRPVVARATAGMSCAVAAVTVESAQLQQILTDAVRNAFESWIDELEAQLCGAGASQPAARRTAMLMITFLEGTQILCRALGDMTPFDEGAAVLRAATRSVLDSTLPGSQLD